MAVFNRRAQVASAHDVVLNYGGDVGEVQTHGSVQLRVQLVHLYNEHVSPPCRWPSSTSSCAKDPFQNS
ncbi:unnamed protein product [Strongylus vulgaris]|uniref:Uncharacterized protein n=1 Tax=Strongylus vulgaris TaxID=40348 RepID=A0A3P7LWA1_STRVU|nr:unnamed protein product [Strongylus vulgaris]